MSAKHTPGPWDVDTEKSEGEYGSGPDTSIGFDDFVIGAEINGKWKVIATTENSTLKEIEEDYDEDYHHAWDGVGKANARLIAAAPEMLSALMECALEIAQIHNRKLTLNEQIALDNARAVIAKATGAA